MYNKKSLGIPCPKGCVQSNRFPYIFNAANEIDYIDPLQMKLKYFKLGQDPPDM
jgi:hypothetical protein